MFFSFNFLAATEVACESHEPHFLQSVEQYYDRAAKLSNVNPGTLSHLRAVDSVLRVTFPIELGDGKYEVIEGKYIFAIIILII